MSKLQKYIKSQDAQVESTTSYDVVKKERATQYNIYTDEGRRRYFYFLTEKLMKPKEAAKAANVNYDTARKWKQDMY
ncbi:hypothetical protein RMATCC62417_15184 [Rhizopus microsporus]|nr:hypothetical protein RMATCC62417_15184 [Rhizopus microsporus]